MQSRSQPRCVGGYGFLVVVQRRVLVELLEEGSALLGVEIWTEQTRLISRSTGAVINVVGGKRGGLPGPEVVGD